jgi:putative DNA primase/helicase
MTGFEASASRLFDVRKLVETESLLPVGRDFNELNGLINLKNGMFELEKKKLIPHDKDFLSTMQLNVTYNSGSACPRWEQFLKEIFEDDEERIELVQEFVGYSLVPDTRYEKALLLIGEGANGKSTLLRVWEELVGEGNISSVTLGGLSNEFHRVTLHRKLLNMTAEINPMTVGQSDYFKRIVSGDRIDAAHKFQPVFHYKPYTRLCFAMNRMPRVKDTSFGFYRRLLMVPFQRVFDGDDADRELSKKLLTEIDGIFLWALEGLERLYRNDSFIEPSTVTRMLQDYKRANNPLVSFVEDNCRLSSEASTKKETLYSEYKKYTEDFGYKAAGLNTFFRELYAAFPDLQPTRPRTPQGRENLVQGITVVRVI